MNGKRGKYDANLPKNLTYRKNRKSFFWRNPTSRNEISLGQISRRDAIAQAIEENHYIEQSYSPVELLDKIKGVDTMTLNTFMNR